MASAAIPKTTKAWTIEGKDGFESLKFHKEVPIPAISDNEVLVKFHAASLNYRDLIIPKGIFTNTILFLELRSSIVQLPTTF